MNEREKIEAARAELRKDAEEFFCMTADDIPAEIYAAFCAGYADGKTKALADLRKDVDECREFIKEKANDRPN